MGSQTLTIFKKGDDGCYSKVKARYRTAYNSVKTPTGTFTLSYKSSWHTFTVRVDKDGDGQKEYVEAYARYCFTYYQGSSANLYLHGPLYYSHDPNDLIPDYYDGSHAIGGNNTGGCLRMVVKAIKFICENCPSGTKLTIVRGTPLGTSSDPVPPRNGLMHDPTDPDASETP